MIRRRAWGVLTCVAIAAAAVAVSFAFHTTHEEAQALTSFFEEVDHNRDGQVDEDEAKRYIGERIGGLEYDTAGELTEAFRHMVKNIDTDATDKANLISVNEVQQHLHTLHQVIQQCTTQWKADRGCCRRCPSRNGCSMDWDCRSTPNASG